jgi:hypothetical protein
MGKQYKYFFPDAESLVMGEARILLFSYMTVPLLFTPLTPLQSPSDNPNDDPNANPNDNPNANHVTFQ